MKALGEPVEIYLEPFSLRIPPTQNQYPFSFRHFCTRIKIKVEPDPKEPNQLSRERVPRRLYTGIVVSLRSGQFLFPLREN